MRKMTILTLVAASLAAGLALAAKPATVRLVQEGLALELTLDNKQKILVTSKGMTLAPGTYEVKGARLLKQDDKKRTWEMRREEGTLSTLATLAVEPEQDKAVDAGEPLLFDVWFWQHTLSGKRSIALRFAVLGRYSEVYFPGAFCEGKRPPTPRFTLKDKDGRVLLSEQLPKPGLDGISVYEWSPPPAFTGHVQIDLEPVMGPFEWKYRRDVPTDVK